MYNKKRPWRYEAQLNGKSAQENYSYFKEMRQMEEDLYIYFMSQLDAGAGDLEGDIANNIDKCIDAVFAGGSIHPEALNHLSFARTLGIGMGRVIGSLPELFFKQLNENEKD